MSNDKSVGSFEEYNQWMKGHDWPYAATNQISWAAWEHQQKEIDRLNEKLELATSIIKGEHERCELQYHGCVASACVIGKFLKQLEEK